MGPISPWWADLIAVVIRDTDNDGWTDLEERVLQIDPRLPDTDGDGLLDGDDPEPNFAHPLQALGEDEKILAEAIRTAFALTLSRQLLVANDSTPVAVAAYRGARDNPRVLTRRQRGLDE